MNCLECGACCRYVISQQATITSQEFELLQTRGILVIRTRKGITFVTPYPCPHLQQDNRCDIYEQRPALCREFVVGCSLCKFCQDVKAKEFK